MERHTPVTRNFLDFAPQLWMQLHIGPVAPSKIRVI